jgi:GNAT superfamily N-acetyltransferase
MIAECHGPEDIRATFPVMRQLRPHLESEAEYVELVERMRAAHGFRLAAFRQEGRCTGVAGFTVETRLFTGKMLYVADLVVDEACRGAGTGRALLDWLKAEARRLGCSEVFLDSGVQRPQAHKFYFREGFHIASYSFRHGLQDSQAS